TDTEIEVYRTRDYPAWLNSVREQLEHLHEQLEQHTKWPCFRVETANNGSRPAESVLIKVETRGELEIENDEHADDDEAPQGSDRGRNKVPRLALPPIPPRGKTETINPYDFAAGLRTRELDVRNLTAFGLPAAMAAPRRPDRFYWRSGKQGPTDLFELECAAWRHSETQVQFTIGVRPYSMKEISGAVEFTVHAANLSLPRKAKLPVRFSTVEGSTIERARSLVQSLIYCARTEHRL
ncbi:MAG TPA: hypothetical protein VE968_07765, partial [Sphingomicrobium sp.]|nr:hypothetical protein [Sphingomicrobium sp.]